MIDGDLWIAVLVGLLQGLFEWLPISSEGNVTIVLTALEYDPARAVGLSLFLHAGTAIAATAYYRDTLGSTLRTAPDVDPRQPFDGEGATLAFLVVGTIVSGVVAIAAYLAFAEVVSELAGGALVAVIGLLLLATGLVQRFAGALSLGDRSSPTAIDAVLVGILQGVAVLPGISRSGTTVSGLLFRGYDGERAFDLSFLLSIPAALGAGVLAVAEAGGLPGVSASTAAVALAVAAVVGYLSIDALLRVVRRIAFWAVCVGLGSVALLGGLLLALA